MVAATGKEGGDMIPEYGRFGFGIHIHQNGEVTLSLTGKSANGEGLRRVEVGLTELQGVMLLSDLTTFTTDYIRGIVQEQAMNHNIRQVATR